MSQPSMELRSVGVSVMNEADMWSEVMKNETMVTIVHRPWGQWNLGCIGDMRIVNTRFENKDGGIGRMYPMN